MSKVYRKITLFAILGILALAGLVMAAGQSAASSSSSGQKIADGTRPTGLKPVDAAQFRNVVETRPRVGKVHLNPLGFDRVNETRARKGKPALSSSLIRPLGQDLETAIGPGASPSALPSAFSLSATATALPEPLFAADLPAVVDNSALVHFPPIRDQGLLNSCASFSTTYYQLSYMAAYQQGLDITDNLDNTDKYTPKWAYTMVNGGTDGGSYILENYDLLEKHGAATWAEFPYDADYLAWCLTPGPWLNALSVRTNPVQYVYNLDPDDEIGQIKAVLNNGYVLGFGTYIYSWQGQYIMDDPATLDDDAEIGRAVGYFVDGTMGSHAMTIVGYNDAIWTDVNGNLVVDPGEKGAFKIANSWGSAWMNDGFIWLAYDALRPVSALPDGPSVSREPALQSGLAFVMVPRAGYSPSMVAEFTVTQALRNQIVLSLGASNTGVTSPTATWQPAAFQAQGGPLAFDGSATAVPATFVLDFTDLLLQGAGERTYYLGVEDGATGDPTTVSAYKIVDLTVPIEVEADCDPAIDVDGVRIDIPVNHLYTGPATNHAPVLGSGQVQPATGTTEDPYTYFVYYTDEDGDAPVTKSVYIDDTAYEMAPVETDPGWYYHISYLTVGIHNFRFLFTDGNGGSAADPAAGTYSGPYVMPIHFVNAPSSPTGETVTPAGSSWTYTTGGSICSSGHDVQYRFDWGDGSVSDWLAVHQLTAAHSWAGSGTYAVKAQARCLQSISVESAWSEQLLVTVPSGIPFAESFASSGFPAGWIQQNEGEDLASLWYLVASSEAGGAPYEMRRIFQAVTPGTTRLVTCPIDTTGHASLRLRFKHFLDTYAIGGVVLKVQTSTDRVNWTDEAWTITSADVNIGPATVDTTLVHNLGSTTTFVGFVVTGNLDLFDYWYIDDIAIDGPSSVKVDFNRDGQEDILWRYYGGEAYQGLNLAWLMQWSETEAPIPLSVSPAEAAPKSLLTGLASTAAVPAPRSVMAAGTGGMAYKSTAGTVMKGGIAKAPKPPIVLKNPTDIDRGPSTVSAKSRPVLNVPRGASILKEPLTAAAASPGTAEIASLSLGTEVFVSIIPDTAWEIAGTGDFNGDGNVDILWRYYGTGPLQGMNDIWFMDGIAFQSENIFSVVTDTNWRIAGTGDFDADGKTDILWRYSGTGAFQGYNVLWFMDGPTVLREALINQIADLDWRIGATGDFNGDGMTDILWRNYGTGALQGYNLIWYMAGADRQGEVIFSQILDTAWEIAATGDFNSDGKTDILWRYYGTGAFQGINDIWYMDGVTFLYEEIFSIIADTSWRISNR